MFWNQEDLDTEMAAFTEIGTEVSQVLFPLCRDGWRMLRSSSQILTSRRFPGYSSRLQSPSHSSQARASLYSLLIEKSNILRLGEARVKRCMKEGWQDSMNFFTIRVMLREDGDYYVQRELRRRVNKLTKSCTFGPNLSFLKSSSGFFMLSDTISS